MAKINHSDVFDSFDFFDVLYFNKAGGSTTTWL